MTTLYDFDFQPYSPIVTGRSTVWSLVIGQIADALLVGEENEHRDRPVQYDLASGRVTKDYGSLGVGALLARTRLGSLCFFGESSRWALRLSTLSRKGLCRARSKRRSAASTRWQSGASGAAYPGEKWTVLMETQSFSTSPHCRGSVPAVTTSAGLQNRRKCREKALGQGRRI